MEIRRGEVVVTDLNPTRGTEPGKRRPVVVVQSNLLNDSGHPSTLVCPITSKIQEGIEYLRVPIPAGIAGLEKSSAILVDQIRAIDNRRFLKSVGHVPDGIMTQLSDRLVKIMDLT